MEHNNNLSSMKIFVYFAQVMHVKANPKEGRDELNGVAVEYCFFGDGDMMKCRPFDANSSFIRRGKAFLDLSLQAKIEFVPGIYEGMFEMSVSSDGKPNLKLVDLLFVNKASVIEVKEPAPSEPKK